SNLHVPLPLACNTFIQDLGQDLYQWGVAYFLTLFDPTIAMRYGYKKKSSNTLDLDDHKADIQQCLQIHLSSHHPWYAQFSSTPHQHHLGVAISTMQLHKDKHIYQYYLGEDIVWNLFSKILGLIEEFAPSFKPWHGISSAEHRTPNSAQVILQKSLHDETIGPLLGATMAQISAAINERYRVGLRQVSKAVQDMAVYKHEDKNYISYDVNVKLCELYQILAKECIHQA
ncbi:hypothetical protein BYT27DRAFT_7006728, partial [Phlegmacium glaucopus]